MKKIKYLFIGLIYFLALSNTQAQPTDYKENVTVVAPYQPTISDANKLNEQPKITDTNFQPTQLTYDFLIRKFKTEYVADRLKPAKVGDAALTRLYKFLLKAGFGNYIMPYGELFVNNIYSKNYNVGAYLKHLSVSGKIKGYAHPGNSENIIKFYGKRIFKEHTLYGNMGYNRNTYHYYGFKPDDYPIQPVDKDMYRQRFNLITANFAFNTRLPKETKKINYGFGLNYYYLNDVNRTAENNFDFSGDVNKDLHLFKFTSSQVIGLQARINYFFGDDTTTNYNAGIITVKPYIKTSFKGFSCNLGIDVSTAIDSTSKMHFYPFGDVQVNIVKNILIAYAGIKGGLIPNSYFSLTKENPFLVSKIHLYPSSERYNIFGGIKSNISKSINISANVSYSNIKDLPLYVNDTSLLYDNQFAVIFDNAKLLKVSGEFAFQKDEKYKLLIGGNFYNYKMASELKAWHKPIFDAYMDFQYNIGNKFIVSANVTGRSNVYAKSYENGAVVKKTLKGYADIGLGVEYRYSKILSAFITINNLTATRYFKWNNYPSYGFNLMAGVTYSF